MLGKISFDEKLQTISTIYFGNCDQSFSEDDFRIIENDLNVTIPVALRKFYLMFGGRVDFLKCMYNITLPREFYIENNVLMFAKEYQNVCAYGISIDTQKPIYFDISNDINEPVDQEIEDFLLYMLAIQGTEFSPCVGKISAKLATDLEEHLLKMSESSGEKAVFCSKDGVIGVIVGNEIFISAKSDECMEKFESDSGLEIDYL